MKDFNSFINPKRKDNHKFVLSEAFRDENGELIEWEMRQLSAEEGVAITNSMPEKASPTDTMLRYVAESLVCPDLRNAALLSALGEKIGRPVFEPDEALKRMVTDGEMAKLTRIYISYNQLTADFRELVEEIKN